MTTATCPRVAATILLVMGVSGSGKTTVGLRLAARLKWPFKEGDELHPPANIAKMKAGIALDDADRGPWLAAVGRWIDAWIASGVCGVIACSALKRAYRTRLSEGRPQIRYVFLKGSEATLKARVAARRGHFMPPSLLASQIADLEAPTPDEHPIVINIDKTVEAQVDDVVQALNAFDAMAEQRGEARP